MKTYSLDNFKNGWIVGNFQPSILKGDFEVGLHRHKKGEHHQDHFHKKSTEINLVVSGEISINNCFFKKNDIFVLEPYEVSQVEYLTDVEILVIRDMSDPTDKYEFKIIDRK